MRLGANEARPELLVFLAGAGGRAIAAGGGGLQVRRRMFLFEAGDGGDGVGTVGVSHMGTFHLLDHMACPANGSCRIRSFPERTDPFTNLLLVNRAVNYLSTPLLFDE